MLLNSSQWAKFDSHEGPAAQHLLQHFLTVIRWLAQSRHFAQSFIRSTLLWRPPCSSSFPTHQNIAGNV